MQRAWWEQRHGGGNINDPVCNCSKGRDWGWIRGSECQVGEFAFCPVCLGSPREFGAG